MHVMGSVSQGNESEGFSFQEEDVAVAEVMWPPSSPSFYDAKGSRTRLPDSLCPPPCPPLPPPPLPPPPPPLGPAMANPAVELKKKRRVRSFFWKTIPEDKVKGRANVWTQGQVQQHFQIDVQKMEELFGQNDRQSPAATTPPGGGKTRGPFREAKEEVSVLDAKRGMNVGIFLKQFKRSNQIMVDDIRHGNSESFGAEPLRELLKLLPEKDEVKKLKAYRGDAAKLPLADSFMYLLMQVPSYSVRIESMLLKEEFPGACDAMKQDIKTLRTATTELMSCTELHAVLHLVLQAGNILNAGGYAGNALAFKLSSLLSLADTKANRPGMNLLHFVALEAQKKDEKLLEFPQKLSHIQAASRISLETLDTELQLLTCRTRSVEESVQRDTELLQQLDSFLQSATSSLCSLRGSRQQLKKEGSELIDFFCEDRDTFRLDDCFSIFHGFCSKFKGAVKENMQMEVKEAARRRQIQEQEEQKRHSWAGGEQVGGAYRTRCSSEADMSAAVLRDSEAGLLMELLTSKRHTRSPHNNSQSLSGRPGSLRRTRNSPSTSPSIAAERELCSLLEMRSDQKVAHQKGRESRTALPPASPELRTRLSPSGVVAQQAPSGSPTNSWSPENSNHTASTYLSYDRPQTRLNANAVKVTLTSDLNQRSDHNNNENDQLSLGFSNQEELSLQNTPKDTEMTGMNKDQQVLSRQIICSNDKTEDETATAGNMSVVFEKCTLVPELRGFDEASALTSCSEAYHASRHQHDLIITDMEDEEVEKSVQNAENYDVHNKTSSSSSQREDERDKEDKVVVWCVTGVCEVGGEKTVAPAEKDQYSDDNRAQNTASSAPANHKPLELQLANEKPVPAPISSQPVPVSRCGESALPVSFSRRCPAQPASASVVPAVTTDASEEDNESASQVKEPDDSAAKKTRADHVTEQSAGDSCKNKMTPRRSTKELLSTDKKVGQATSSKLSTQNSLGSKPRQAGIKPSTPKTTSSVSRSKPVRTLTKSESQDMRRIVPITRTSRSTWSLTKQPEKPPSHHRDSTKTSVLNSLTVSSHSSSSLRQGERPATAPTLRRFNSNKIPESKNSRDNKMSGTRASVQEHNQDLKRKPSIRKPLTKSKNQMEEKICRSTLRALSLGGGVGSVSAPATPAKTNSSSLLPGFAQSTASSSFRWTQTNLATSIPSHSPNAGSPKLSPMTTSSNPSTAASSGFTRTGSLRVAASSRSSDLPNSSSSSTPRRSQSIKSSTRSPLHSSLAPRQGHRRNDSGSFSDKSTHSRDSGKSIKPSWR